MWLYSRITDGGSGRALRGGFSRKLTWLVLYSLFLGGVVHWGFFFHWGDMQFASADWPKEQYYYSVLRAAVTEPAIPYYVSPSRGDPRFLGIPETVLSPQIILMTFTG